MADPVIWNAEAFNNPGGTAALADRYYSANQYNGNNSTGQIGRGIGANQGFGMSGNPGADLGFTLPTPSTTCGQAQAFSRFALFTTEICSFYDGDNFAYLNFRHLTIRANGAGYIEVWRDDQPVAGTDSITYLTLIGTSSAPVPLSPGFDQLGWYHIEVIVHIDFSSGSVHIKLDEVDVLNLTSINTRGAHSTTANIVVARMGGGGGSGSSDEGCSHTDWIVHDGSNFIGDCRVDYLPAANTGTRTYTAGTTVGDSTAILAVNDDHFTAGEDHDYIDLDDTSLPKKTTFHVTALPTNVITVKAVIPRAAVRKTDAGVNQGRMIFISGATETDGGADVKVPTNWRAYERVYQTDPNTSSAWTVINANAVEVGFERTV